MEMHFAAYLDLVGKRYTGAGPQGSFLAMDKSIAKKIIRYHELHTPYFAVVNKGVVEHAQDIQLPGDRETRLARMRRRGSTRRRSSIR